VRLSDLEAFFVRREVRACAGPGSGCSTTSPHSSHEYHYPTETIADADGVYFLCPKCFAENGGPIGTHSVICWRPRMPAEVLPGPGRWEFVGTGLGDLTLRAGSSSVALRGGCAAHFFVEQGAIRMCAG
jgi:hypothetical protein